jgi:ADP-ribose pyrophosphatase YjhB (NUDIX family)
MEINAPPSDAPIQRKPPMLRYKINRYGDVVVLQSSIIEDLSDFEVSAASLVEASRKAGRRAVWLKIPARFAYLLPRTQKIGFSAHHANQTYYMMVYRMDPTMDIPYASHVVRVVALVVRWISAPSPSRFKQRSEPQILLVREKRTFHASVWKLPSGNVEENELISDSATREVKEETGCDTVFAGILAIGNKTAYRWNNNAVIVACLLRTAVRDISVTDALKPDGKEVDACEWVFVDDAVRRLPQSSMDVWFIDAAFGERTRSRDLEPMPERNAMRFVAIPDPIRRGKSAHVHAHEL